MLYRGVIFAVLLLAYAFSLPRDLFKDTPYSTVVTDRNGRVIGARIASDGQWRFPPGQEVSGRFAKALVAFEDRRFYLHPGVDPLSVTRAVLQNVRARRVVSGASTISMQVVRMSRSRERNLFQKMIETVLATRLEIRYTKSEILAMYASHAPFGGNVVGLEAASWRYFGHASKDLSWGEAASLAVLPNAPDRIRPGKNRDAFLAKRNRLLRVLYRQGCMDSIAYGLACEEPLPDEPVSLPSLSSQLCDFYAGRFPGCRIRTTLDAPLQERVESSLQRWNREFSRRGVSDLAAVVVHVPTGEIVAYCGNADPQRKRPGSCVDAARSARSTGSILKPLLYAALLQEGSILPATLLPDIPIHINGFSPQNFDMNFYGAVPAAEALARSLNVPSVHMLRRYGVDKFYELLKDLGLHTLDRPASDYGLSLILGGAEGRLLDITVAYASISASLQSENGQVWRAGLLREIPRNLGKERDAEGKNAFPEFSTPFSGWPEKESVSEFHACPLADKVALYYVVDALKEVNRPDEMDWRRVASLGKVAWKTGTSYGFRDAWAVGITPEYAIGVWAGNAQGQGSPGLTGAGTAGPVMFDLFNLLPASGHWFDFPGAGYREMEVCRISGHLRGRFCPEWDTLKVPLRAVRSTACPYHRPFLLDAGNAYRVPASCPGAHPVVFFVLPPAMEWYYRKYHPEYALLPPYSPGTFQEDRYVPMQFIYPENGSVVYVPRQLDGSRKGVVFHLAHSNPLAEVFWHLDNRYLGSTRNFHQMALDPPLGRHSITVVDAEGNTLSVGVDFRQGRENP